VIGEGPDLVIHATSEQLTHMGDFVTEMHTKSGLLGLIEASTVSVAAAEEATLNFLRRTSPRFVPFRSAVTPSGPIAIFCRTTCRASKPSSTIATLNVSTIKELARRWYPEILAELPEKDSAHRALDDIRESIAELQFYRARLFLPATAVPEQS